MRRAVLLSVFLLSLAPGDPASAQGPPLVLPEASPKASVSQTIGLTDISISYHRPAVNARKVWGGLVSYGEVWRAGANENTVISFSTPVTVAGQKLAAGRYGLHMLPTEKDWTVIFSTQSNAWGSFGYDQKEDAARVSATPRVSSMEERLSYTFDDPTDKAVTVSLNWEKLKVPIKVEVDVAATVTANIREQMRGLPRFFWQGWNQAAAWCARNDTNLDEALTWVDRSIGIARNFTNLRTKATILEKKGDAKGAEKLREEASKVATEAELNQLGYQLLGQKKVDEAIETFQRNVTEHPKSWNVHDSLAEAYAAKGDKAKATASYRKALELTTDEAQKERIQKELAKLK